MRKKPNQHRDWIGCSKLIGEVEIPLVVALSTGLVIAEVFNRAPVHFDIEYIDIGTER